MKKLNDSIVAFCLFGFTYTIQAQNAVSASGGSASGSGGSVSYSVGQVFYNTHVGINGTVAQGVQQAYEISVVTNIEEDKAINLSISAYPNPTNDYLILKIEKFEILNLSYKLYNIKGKLLQIEKITGNQTIIGMGNLVPATYFVKVIQGQIEVKTFKIIKN